jgi:hypothetical protein
MNMELHARERDRVLSDVEEEVAHHGMDPKEQDAAQVEES